MKKMANEFFYMAVLMAFLTFLVGMILGGLAARVHEERTVEKLKAEMTKTSVVDRPDNRGVK